jgi:hypothetical protein
MNWPPWVSKRAYDEVVRQRDRLEEQNDRLVDHAMRMDRIEHGTSEVAPSGEPKEPMSDEVIAEIRRWKGKGTQYDMTMEAKRLYALPGATHESVLAALRQNED